MKRICVVTGTRAEYGLLKPVMREISASKKLSMQVIATGMHLLEEYGSTYKEIIGDGFKIDKMVDMASVGDTGYDMALSVSNGIRNLGQAFKEMEPGMILILGDRVEPLAAAIAASYMGYPLAHIHGGDLSGSKDEPTRHAITKLSHLHFAVTEKSRQRIIRMGENPDMVFNVGAPGLDEALHGKLLSKEETMDKFGIVGGRYILLVQHPDTNESEKSGKQFETTLRALKGQSLPTIIIYPNSDAGSGNILQIIKGIDDNNMKCFKSLGHIQYLSLMRHASVLVGNSSSGIIEAPSFCTPVVNIGRRQEGRERAENVIDVDYDSAEIRKAVMRALSDDYRKSLIGMKNPYGDGTAAKKIVRKLEEIAIDGNLRNKRWFD